MNDNGEIDDDIEIGPTLFGIRSKMLIVHGVTAERWQERYGLQPFVTSCPKCGAEMKTTIPFAYQEYRGLFAPKCGCGNEDAPYCLVRDPKFGDLLEF